MRRSSLVVLVTFLVGMVLPALPASAATSANVAAPTGGQEITKDAPVPVRVLIERLTSDPAVKSVAVQLFREGSQYSLSALSCSDGCGSSRQTWVGAFDPRPGPIRNGAYNLQVQVNDGAFDNKISVYLSLPPSPVRNLQVEAQERAVKLTWNKAPEPDISGHRVERRTGDAWQRVATLGPKATSHIDRPPAGTYVYRVVTLRPSGKQDAELTAASGASKSTVVAPPKDPATQPTAPAKPDGPDPAQDGDPGTASGPGTAAGSTDRGSGPAEGAPRGSGPAEGAPGGSGAGPRVTRGPLAGSVPPPPPARRDFSFNLRSLARAFGYEPQDEAEGAEEDYFGEGEPFSEELDYSGIDPVTGEPIEIDVPLPDSGLQSTVISHLANRPLLASLAFGLLFVVLALLILRWIRRSPPGATGQGSVTAASTGASAARKRLFRSRGGSVTPAAVQSPTAAPLAPRAPSQARPVMAPRAPSQAGPVRGQDAAGTTNARPAGTSTPARSRTRPSAVGSLLPRDAEARQGSRDEAPSGTSDLFPQRRSSATAPSARDRSDPDAGSDTVKVLRPPSSRETGRSRR